MLLWPAVASAHGVAPQPSSLVDVLAAWQLEPHVVLPIIAAGWVYGWAVWRVNLAHPNNRVPRLRVWCWFLGLVSLGLALVSPIAAYDTTFFSIHMVQHLLLTMVAAPLLALGAPFTLLLRVSSPRARQRWVLPLLQSRLMRLVSFPVVTWVVFAGVLWASHFSALYDASLESEPVHVLEHALYLGAALLFWWPVVGADPSPWRMPHPGRIGYLFLGMPQSSFLGLAIISAPNVLYPHYATLTRNWGPSPFLDQQWAGAIMWIGGDLVFLIALILAVWVWMRAEEREGQRVDAQLAREEARRAGEAHDEAGQTSHRTMSAPSPTSFTAPKDRYAARD